MHQERSRISPTCLPGQGGFAKADAALEILAMVRDAMSPPVVVGFFIGRIYSNLPCLDMC